MTCLKRICANNLISDERWLGFANASHRIEAMQNIALLAIALILPA
jgi:hypothetical protein